MICLKDHLIKTKPYIFSKSIYNIAPLIFKWSKLYLMKGITKYDEVRANVVVISGVVYLQCEHLNLVTYIFFVLKLLLRSTGVSYENFNKIYRWILSILW